ncbi:MAG: hypothetical protein ACU84Q_07065 [Gammaproteobacteria bacterium]
MGAQTYFLGLLICLLQFTSPIAFGDVSEQQYLILSSVLNHGLGKDCAEIVIEEKTTGGTIAIHTPQKPLTMVAETLGVDANLLKEWEKENTEFDYLGENFDLPCRYHLITTEQRNLIFASAAGDEPERGWRNFRRKFTDAAGIIRVAKPVIDTRQNHALAYVEFDCGPGCGSGRFVTLENKPHNTWRVTGGSLVWMAAE